MSAVCTFCASFQIMTSARRTERRSIWRGKLHYIHRKAVPEGQLHCRRVFACFGFVPIARHAEEGFAGVILLPCRGVFCACCDASPRSLLLCRSVACVTVGPAATAACFYKLLGDDARCGWIPLPFVLWSSRLGFAPVPPDGKHVARFR